MIFKTVNISLNKEILNVFKLLNFRTLLKLYHLLANVIANEGSTHLQMKRMQNMPGFSG